MKFLHIYREYTGACTLLQEALGHDLLHLACRHHILEIVAEKAFTAMKIVSSTGPDIAVFRHFREKWHSIDRSKFVTAADSVEIADFKDHTINFSQSPLAIFHPRDDYSELLELVIIFLGGTSSRGFHFRAPGALHRARWMARILLSFKIWMFRSQFKLTRVEETGIFQFKLFISEVYIQAWFEAPSSASAPANDLAFLKKLSMVSNSDIRTVTTNAFKRHLWYLSEVTVGLAFFDRNISADEKRDMITEMKDTPGSKVSNPRLNKNYDAVGKPLSSFVTRITKALFTILGLNEAFLLNPPESWKDDQDYLAAERIVSRLTVVNYTAERGVKLMQDYNSILKKTKTRSSN